MSCQNGFTIILDIYNFRQKPFEPTRFELKTGWNVNYLIAVPWNMIKLQILLHEDIFWLYNICIPIVQFQKGFGSIFFSSILFLNKTWKKQINRFPFGTKTFLHIWNTRLVVYLRSLFSNPTRWKCERKKTFLQQVLN